MASTLSCPRCQQQLERTTTPHGVFYGCAGCGGKALGVDVLRRTFARDEINAVWRRAITGEGTAGRACPSCRNAMLEVSATEGEQPLRIDVCRLCHSLWFDADELVRLTPLPPNVARASGLRDSDTRKPEARATPEWQAVAELLNSPVDWAGPAAQQPSKLWLVILGALAAALVAVLLRVL